MSKIIKNQKSPAADIVLKAVGRTVPASGQIEVHTEDYLLWASIDSIAEITPFINSGDIVINDGTSDLPTAEGLNFLDYPDKGQTKVTLNDTTLNYLIDKIVSGTGISITKQNPGANETLKVSRAGAPGSGMIHASWASSLQNIIGLETPSETYEVVAHIL